MIGGIIAAALGLVALIAASVYMFITGKRSGAQAQAEHDKVVQKTGFSQRQIIYTKARRDVEALDQLRPPQGEGPSKEALDKLHNIVSGLRADDSSKPK